MEDQYFKEFKEQSEKQLNELQTRDIVPFMGESVNDNYTIAVRPTTEMEEQVQQFVDEFKQIDTSQLYYQPVNLHLTILGGLTMELSSEEFVARTQPIVVKYPIRFHMRGIGSNGYSSSILAYPDGFSLHALREELRAALGQHGPNYDAVIPGYDYMGWMNYLRYRNTPKEHFISLLRRNINRDFGIMEPTNIELYKATSKVLNYYDDTMIHRYI